MSYKTIVIHIDRSKACAQRVQVAAELAQAQGAHLVGVAPTGVSRFIYQSSMGGAVLYGPQLEECIEDLRNAARKHLDRFEEQVAGMALSYESLLVDDEAGTGVALRAHYSDLVVASQFNPDEANLSTAPDFAEYVAAASGRPVLVLPYAGIRTTVGKRPMVAWDASAPATHAIAGALPLLRSADAVDLVVFNALDSRDEHGEEPGADIALYLARHDVKVNVMTSEAKGDIGNALLSLAANCNSDLLVMGCYGHSRFREILAGGVTRTVLESMTLPVLMAH